MTTPYRTPGERERPVTDLIAEAANELNSVIVRAEFELARDLAAAGHVCIDVHRDGTQGWIRYGDGPPTARVCTVHDYSDGPNALIYRTFVELRNADGEWEAQ